MIRRILCKAYAAGLLYLAALPLFLLPAAALVPDLVWLCALLPVPALALAGAAGLLPARRRTIGLLLAVLIAAAGCALLFLPARPLAMLLFLPCLLLMLLFLPAMARPMHQEWSASQLGIGVLVYIAAQFIKILPLFTGVAAALTWGFVVYLIACLFAFNRLVVMGTGSSAAKPLLRKNRRLLAAVCLLALLLANLNAVAAAIRAAVQWIITAVMRVLEWAAALFITEQTAGDSGGASLGGLAEASEPSLFAQIMKIAMTVIGALIVAVLLWFLLKRLMRVLKSAFHTIIERLQAYRQKISADYDDQSESLLDWEEMKETAAVRINRLKRRYLPTPWEKLSPAQRVRRVYALLLRRQKEPDPARTARETLSSGILNLQPDDAAALAALYDRARYSAHPISAQDADELRRRAGV